MKIKFWVLFISFISIVASCSETKSSKQAENTEVEEIVDEDFYAFLENFNKKATFQRQRVVFPLKATLLDPSEYGMETVNEEIKYQDWILLDFSYDSSYATRQMDGYQQTIRLYNDSSIIEHRGVDNGIYSNYFFIKRDGKWYLDSLTDVSF